MNIQQKILNLLKETPMNRLSLVKFIPEELPEAVSRNLNALLIQGKLSHDGHDYSLISKKSKYNNIRTIIDGIKFDSAGEADRYMELKILEKAGEIKGLERQIPFIISNSVQWEGKTLKAIKYVSDFRYHDNNTGREVVEDFKGKRTALYILKRSLFVNRYPEYWFREVKK